MPLLPVVDDHDTGPFWKAAHEERLVVQECVRCAEVLHLPRNYCHFCGSWETRWVEVSGRARIYSWTVSYTPHPNLEAPYTIVLVELEERPNVRLVGCLPAEPDLAVGMPMQARFEHIDDVTTLVQWELLPVEAGRA